MPNLLIVGWFDVEMIKLVATVSVPIVVALVGYALSRRLGFHQKIIEKRVRVYEEIAPLMNDLYCFFMVRGHWKDLSTSQVVQIKRKADKAFYVNRFLFSEQLGELYFSFVVDRCFVLNNQGHGQDAKLRTDSRLYQGVLASGALSASDIALFSGDQPDYGLIRAAYEGLMEQFARELGAR